MTKPLLRGTAFFSATANLLAGERTGWTPVTEGVRRVAGIVQFTLPAVQGQRFFRLAVQ